MTVPFDPALVPVLRSVGMAAGHIGARAWAVGGIVRDALLGLSNKDVDITVEGDVPALVSALGQDWGAELAQHGAFTTATLKRPDGIHVDIVRARSEVYEKPGALPTVTHDGIGEDLKRRDFTVNAMAASLAPEDFGALVDPLGGASDLSSHTLRILRPESFLDDPTRLFRAARYAVRYGLDPEPGTDEAASSAVRSGALWTVSGDRRRREVEIICAERFWAEMLEWLNRWSVWAALADGWQPNATHMRRAEVVRAWAARNLEEPAPKAWPFRFMALLCMAPASVQPALSVRPAEEQTIGRAHHIIETLAGRETPEWRRAMDAEDMPTLLLALTLVRTDSQKRRITEYLSSVRPVRPTITGADILAAGAHPGPAIGLALRETLDAVRAGSVRGRDAELEYALGVFQEWEARFTDTEYNAH